MVAGFAEDIDSEDESAMSPITNHINEDLNSSELTSTNTKPNAVITVELTSSEEDEKDVRSDEEEKRNAKGKGGKKDDRTKVKEDKETKDDSTKFNLEIPDKSWMKTEVDGFNLGTEDVDDWLNSPDSDLKVQLIIMLFDSQVIKITELNFNYHRHCALIYNLRHEKARELTFLLF